MFHYKTNFAIVLILTTFFMFCCSTRSKTDHNCDRTCGEHTLQYPFGFSSGCKVRLNCSSSNNVKRIKIDMLEVQSVTSDSIFVSLPAKCNRSVDFIDPLFGRNFAPTLNNTFLVQSCKSNRSGCVIQTSTFVNQVEGCDSNGEDIRCFTQKQLNGSRVDVLTRSVWTGIRCLSWVGGFKGSVIAPTMHPARRFFSTEGNGVSGADAMKVSTEMDSRTVTVAGERLNAMLQHCGLADVGKQSKLVSLLEGS